MKKVLILIAIFLISSSIWAQIDIDIELQKKLKGKTNFQEIKSLTLEHYNQLSRTVNPSDRKTNKYVKKNLKHLNRKFWIDEFYVNPDGTIGNRGEIDYKAVTKLKKQKRKLKSAQHNPWVLEGPYDMPNGEGIGRFDHLAFHPTDSNIMWAGSPSGGLFKTINGGVSWYPITSYLPSLGVAGLAINYQNPDIIYLLSGDSNNGSNFFGNNDYNASFAGVYKTIDGGLSWDLIVSSASGRDLIIHPTNPDILLVATSIGVFGSKNAGATWTQSDLRVDVRDIEFKPGDPSVVYAVESNKFYKSTDTGSTFSEKVIAGLSGLSGDRIVIGTTLDNPNRVYLFSGPSLDTNGDMEANAFQGFFSSSNSGDAFVRITQTPALFSSTQGIDVSSFQSWYNIAIAVNPMDEDEIFVGGVVVWRSTNGGVSWNQVSAYWDYVFQANYMHPDIHDLQYNPLTNQLFCANDGGIYKRDVSSFDWIPFYNGLSAATFYQFEIEDDNGKLWAGAQDNGIMVQSSGGTFFNYNVGDGFDVMTDHPYDVDNGESNDIFYTINQRICVDKLGNNCTRSVDINIDSFNSFFGKLAMSPVDEDDIYVGYWHGLYYSTNAGIDWTNISSGRPADWCISTCRSNVNVVYTAGSNADWSGRLYKINGPWSDLTGALVSQGYSINLKITDIDVSRTNHDLFYISVGGTKPDSKVFFSDDGGASFTNLSFDLPNVPIFSIKADESGGLYAGTSIGVYYLPNGQNYWLPFYNNLPNVAVTEIELGPGFPPYNKVYISTFGRGIWSTDVFNPNCLDFVSKSGFIEGKIYNEANIQLTSTQTLRGGQYTELRLSSGNRIKLLPGFHAPSGHYLKTYLDGCGADIPK